jgi:3-oxoacyl-[acyl-carrier-protein] synthase II
VVVTGLGLVTPLETGVEHNWEALVSGRSGVGPITSRPASLVKSATSTRHLSSGLR